MTISGAPNKEKVLRAAAILTGSEVPSATLILNEAWGSMVAFQIDFTLGNLTDAYLRILGVTPLGADHYQVRLPDGVYEATLDSNTPSKSIIVVNLPGFRAVNISAAGNGDATGSSLAVTARYLQHGSQNTLVA